MTRGRLFHAIVVMGAAAGQSACGGEVARDAGTSGSGAVGAGGGSGGGPVGDGTSEAGPTEPSDCELEAQFKCESYAPKTNCTCDPNAVAEPSDCASSAQFSCEWCNCYPGGLCFCNPYKLEYLYVSCSCDPAKPADPSACPTTADFWCEHWGPPWWDCQCTSGAPQSEADCNPGANWSCHSYSPPIGCQCFTIITK